MKANEDIEKNIEKGKMRNPKNTTNKTKKNETKSTISNQNVHCVSVW